MTRAKAASVTAALITADYQVTIIPPASGSSEYKLDVRSLDNFPIDVDLVKTFADAQTIDAKVQLVTFE